MNITSDSAKNECTGCQVCAAVCPHKAIGIGLDEYGFYRPVLSSEKCVDCGICVKVCYKFDDIAPTPNERLANFQHFAASATDDSVAAGTSSGGIADLLCKSLLRKGYKCCGVTYDFENNRAVHSIAASEEESNGFRGSKYIQSYTLNAFSEILKEAGNGKAAIFGTPCQIYALSRYLEMRRRRDDFILIDIFCHGCPSLRLWHKYLESIDLNSLGMAPDSVNFRSKAYGWGRYCIAFSGQGKTIYKSPPVGDYFFELFFSNLILNEACHKCTLRSNMEYADIRLGDFWGKSYDLDTRGMSVVSLITDRGREAFAAIEKEIVSKPHPSGDFLPYQSWRQNYDPDPALRNRLLGLLANPNSNIKEAVSLYHANQNSRQKLKRHAKNLLHLLHINERLIKRAFRK